VNNVANMYDVKECPHCAVLMSRASVLFAVHAFTFEHSGTKKTESILFLQNSLYS